MRAAIRWGSTGIDVERLQLSQRTTGGGAACWLVDAAVKEERKLNVTPVEKVYAMCQQVRFPRCRRVLDRRLLGHS